MILNERDIAYIKRHKENALKYQMGLTLTIQEIEELKPNHSPYARDGHFFLSMYRSAKTEAQRIQAEKDLLRHTGRGWLADIGTLSLGDYVGGKHE